MKQPLTSEATNNAGEPKVEKPRSSDAYRAPRLVPLGAAADLVQAFSYGSSFDGYRSYWGHK